MRRRTIICLVVGGKRKKRLLPQKNNKHSKCGDSQSESRSALHRGDPSQKQKLVGKEMTTSCLTLTFHALESKLFCFQSGLMFTLIQCSAGIAKSGAYSTKRKKSQKSRSKRKNENENRFLLSSLFFSFRLVLFFLLFCCRCLFFSLVYFFQEYNLWQGRTAQAHTVCTLSLRCLKKQSLRACQTSQDS